MLLEELVKQIGDECWQLAQMLRDLDGWEQ